MCKKGIGCGGLEEEGTRQMSNQVASEATRTSDWA